MRQALIVGARPLFVRGKQFPKVPLSTGGWRIEIENRKESKVRLTIWRRVAGGSGVFETPSVVEISDREHTLIEGPATVSAEIFDPGREEYINVFAVALNGTGS